MRLSDLLEIAAWEKSSDIHLSVGQTPVMRKNGRFVSMFDKILTSDDTHFLCSEILNGQKADDLKNNGEADLAISDSAGNRYRVNVFKQKGAYSMAIRLLNTVIPSFASLGLPRIVSDLAERTRGLVIVTGTTGSGKSTTLACMIDKINRERDCHIITLEEPIEYLHSHKKSIVNQREIGRDTASFAQGLRASLRQDPDVILIGEMRDLETISIALTAAETGHLVFSTLHTVGAAKTIDRVIDVFPPHQQQQVRTQISTVLQGVISQQLLPRKDNTGRVVAVETMVSTPAVRNLIREGKTFQIANVMQTGASSGMKTMDHALIELYKDNLITRDDCLFYSIDPDFIKKEINHK